MTARGHPHDEHEVDRGYTLTGDELEHDLFVRLPPEKSWRLLYDTRGG